MPSGGEDQSRTGTRAVYRGPDGREYVIGDDGGRVYGTGLVPEREPCNAVAF
jgi:hypothetical protein